MVKQNGDFILDVNQRREFEKLAIDRHVYLSSGRGNASQQEPDGHQLYLHIRYHGRYINRTKRKERMVKMWPWSGTDDAKGARMSTNKNLLDYEY